MLTQSGKLCPLCLYIKADQGSINIFALIMLKIWEQIIYSNPVSHIKCNSFSHPASTSLQVNKAVMLSCFKFFTASLTTTTVSKSTAYSWILKTFLTLLLTTILRTNCPYYAFSKYTHNTLTPLAAVNHSKWKVIQFSEQFFLGPTGDTFPFKGMV